MARRLRWVAMTGLAALIGLASLAVARVSPWLVAPYLVLMGWILLGPRGASTPRADAEGPDEGDEAPDPSVPSPPAPDEPDPPAARRRFWRRDRRVAPELGVEEPTAGPTPAKPAHAPAVRGWFARRAQGEAPPTDDGTEAGLASDGGDTLDASSSLASPPDAAGPAEVDAGPEPGATSPPAKARRRRRKKAEPPEPEAPPTEVVWVRVGPNQFVRQEIPIAPPDPEPEPADRPGPDSDAPAPIGADPGSAPLVEATDLASPIPDDRPGDQDGDRADDPIGPPMSALLPDAPASDDIDAPASDEGPGHAFDEEPEDFGDEGEGNEDAEDDDPPRDDPHPSLGRRDDANDRAPDLDGEDDPDRDDRFDDGPPDDDGPDSGPDDPDEGGWDEESDADPLDDEQDEDELEDRAPHSWRGSGEADEDWTGEDDDGASAEERWDDDGYGDDEDDDEQDEDDDRWGSSAAALAEAIVGDAGVPHGPPPPAPEPAPPEPEGPGDWPTPAGGGIAGYGQDLQSYLQDLINMAGDVGVSSPADHRSPAGMPGAPARPASIAWPDPGPPDQPSPREPEAPASESEGDRGSAGEDEDDAARGPGPSGIAPAPGRPIVRPGATFVRDGRPGSALLLPGARLRPDGLRPLTPAHRHRRSAARVAGPDPDGPTPARSGRLRVRYRPRAPPPLLSPVASPALDRPPGRQWRDDTTPPAPGGSGPGRLGRDPSPIQAQRPGTTATGRHRRPRPRPEGPAIRTVARSHRAATAATSRVECGRRPIGRRCLFDRPLAARGWPTPSCPVRVDLPPRSAPDDRPGRPSSRETAPR